MVKYLTNFHSVILKIVLFIIVSHRHQHFRLGLQYSKYIHELRSARWWMCIPELSSPPRFQSFCGCPEPDNSHLHTGKKTRWFARLGVERRRLWVSRFHSELCRSDILRQRSASPILWQHRLQKAATRKSQIWGWRNSHLHLSKFKWVLSYETPPNIQYLPP